MVRNSECRKSETHGSKSLKRLFAIPRRCLPVLTLHRRPIPPASDDSSKPATLNYLREIRLSRSFLPDLLEQGIECPLGVHGDSLLTAGFRFGICSGSSRLLDDTGEFRLDGGEFVGYDLGDQHIA